MKNTILVVLVILSACKPAEKPAEKVKTISFDIKHIYDSSGFNGCFIIYDSKNDCYYRYDSQSLSTGYIPASTFKICNSLIALETGVAPDQNFILKWDGVKRWSPDWNADQDLKTAFKNSTVWYYQELARRIGKDRMKHWLDTLQYGNLDTTGGIDMFWLNGKLRITPEEQIDFLRRLHDKKLPLSNRTYNIFRDIMVMDSTSDYVLRAKTGRNGDSNPTIAWYVGFFETKDNTYYFSNTIIHQGEAPDNISQVRKDIVFKVFRQMKFIP